MNNLQTGFIWRGWLVTILFRLFMPFGLVADGKPPSELKSWPRVSPSITMEARAAVHRGLSFLLEQQQENGAFGDGPAATSLALIALDKGRDFTSLMVDDAIEKGRLYLFSLVDRQGAISDRQTLSPSVISTAQAMLSWTQVADQEARLMIELARQFLLDAQLRQVSNHELGLGGFPPLIGQSAELKSSQWAIEALALTDFLAVDPNEFAASREIERLGDHYQAAIEFVRACQFPDWHALPEADSAAPFWPEPPTPETMAATRAWPDLLLSTLNGLKIMLYLRSDSVGGEIVSAVEWLRINWPESSLAAVPTENYFEQLFFLAKVMQLLENFESASPGAVLESWRTFTVPALLSRQTGRGAWSLNQAGNHESEAGLQTAYAVLTLMLALEP